MTPDDPRHGTVAGYQAHRRHDTTPCASCVFAKSGYEKRRLYYGPAMVAATGTRRRIQALRALGYTGPELALRLGVSYQCVHQYGTTARVQPSTADRVSALYDALSMTPPLGATSARARRAAKTLGYLPPLAWTDIDDPDEAPNVGGTDNEVDPVVVLRVLQGDRIDAATNAERCAIVARWHETGRPYNDLERQTGWQVWRYRTKEEAAS